MASCSAALIVGFTSRTFLTVKQFDLDGSLAPVSLINYPASIGNVILQSTLVPAVKAANGVY